MLTSAKKIAHVSSFFFIVYFYVSGHFEYFYFCWFSKVFDRKLPKSAVLISEFTAFPKAFSLVLNKFAKEKDFEGHVALISLTFLFYNRKSEVDLHGGIEGGIEWEELVTSFERLKSKEYAFAISLKHVHMIIFQIFENYTAILILFSCQRIPSEINCVQRVFQNLAKRLPRHVHSFLISKYIFRSASQLPKHTNSYLILTIQLEKFEWQNGRLRTTLSTRRFSTAGFLQTLWPTYCCVTSISVFKLCRNGLNSELLR